MNRLAEAAVFAALALGLHLALALALTQDRPGSPAAGTGGAAAPVALAAAPPQIAALVEAWDTPPAPETGPAAEPAAPSAAAAAEPMPDLPAAPPLPSSRPDRPEAPEAEARPEPPSPETARKPAPPRAASAPAAAPAQGSGGRAGNGAPASATEQARAAEIWFGEIRARVAARRMVPRRVSAPATVWVRLTVSRSGALLAHAVQTSSGNAAYDRVALASVERAGRFPPAPAALAGSQFTFALPIRFAP
ncbi:TonB family protein [Rhodobacteraceae bacterium DSL-40]|uniref:TonB family protein n=1 Tax=Amaricoccus sp. B4 TaxID=3368557 RepID=UPI000DADEA99